MPRPPHADAEPSTREAALRCIAEGAYPSLPRLRQYGALGGDQVVYRVMDALIARQEIVLPPHQAARRRGIIGKRRAGPAPVRIPRPIDPNPSPCAADVREYRAAWRRITRRPPCRSCT